MKPFELLKLKPHLIAREDLRKKEHFDCKTDILYKKYFNKNSLITYKKLESTINYCGRKMEGISIFVIKGKKKYFAFCYIHTEDREKKYLFRIKLTNAMKLLENDKNNTNILNKEEYSKFKKDKRMILESLTDDSKLQDSKKYGISGNEVKHLFKTLEKRDCKYVIKALQ